MKGELCWGPSWGEMVSGHRSYLSPGTGGFWEGWIGLMARAKPMLAQRLPFFPVLLLLPFLPVPSLVSWPGLQALYDPDNPCVCLQCRMECRDVPAETLYDVLHDIEYRKKWDSNVIETFDIARLTVNADVGYYSCEQAPAC